MKMTSHFHRISLCLCHLERVLVARCKPVTYSDFQIQRSADEDFCTAEAPLFLDDLDNGMLARNGASSSSSGKMSIRNLAVIFWIGTVFVSLYRRITNTDPTSVEQPSADAEPTQHDVVPFVAPERPVQMLTPNDTKWALSRHDFHVEPVDIELVQRFAFAELVNAQLVPVSRVGSTAVVATAIAPTDPWREIIRERLDVADVEWRSARPNDITHVLRSGFRDELLHESVYGLKERDPDGSAFQVITKAQKRVLITAAVIAVALAVAWPRLSLQGFIVAINALMLSGILFKFIVSIVGARNEQMQLVSDDEVAALNDDDLPVYTVLVPAYKESNVVGLLMNNLKVLDWPAEKLQILLLLEEDDAETIAAADAADLPDTVTVLKIPDAHPKTKPKACNFGLQFTRGEYVVIFDAEDKPDRDQLKKAFIAFRKGGEKMVVVQAALNYFNRGENFLTRMFTLEYSFWFDYMLPGLSKLKLPIPLGGTSNHFRTDMLRELGAWDPFNVTEDADLGIRASAKGYTVGVVNSTTYEEANKEAWNWIRQRSRWIKGYMQTTLVHTRRPRRLVKAAGWKQSLGFLLLIGGTPATFLAAPPLAILSIIQLFTIAPGTSVGWLSQTVLAMSLFNFLFGNAIMIYLNVLAVFKRRYYDLVLFALLNPLYWNFHIVSSYKAAIQLITKPFYWEKTNHGLTDETAHDEVLDDDVAVRAA
jgi:cellulose synthase/poly-beta-1,6-N-acetylglucosamine synthase-like glycosyltransferase